jgi:hypothetical protein
MGKAADLARRVKPGLDLIGHVKAESLVAASTGGTALDTAKLAKSSATMVNNLAPCTKSPSDEMTLQ